MFNYQFYEVTNSDSKILLVCFNDTPMVKYTLQYSCTLKLYCFSIDNPFSSFDKSSAICYELELEGVPTSDDIGVDRINGKFMIIEKLKSQHPDAKSAYRKK